MEKKLTNKRLYIWSVLLLIIWAIFSIYYIHYGLSTKNTKNLWILSLSVEIVLDFIILYVTYTLSMKCHKDEVAIFLLFFIACIVRTLNDFTYNFFINILAYLDGKSGLENIAAVTNTMSMLFIILALIIIFTKAKEKNSKRSLWWLLVLNICIFSGMFYLFRNERWSRNLISISDFYIWCNVVLRGIAFSFLIMNFIISKNNYFRVVITGYLIIVLDAFFLHFFNPELLLSIQRFCVESFWILGLLFIVFGFSLMRYSLKKSSSDLFFKRK